MQGDIRGGAYLSPAEMAHLTQNWAPYRSLGGKWSCIAFTHVLITMSVSVLYVGCGRRV